MARQKDQTMRFSDVELAQLKSMFADNEELLFIIRKIMLQVGLTDDEAKIAKEMITDANLPLLYKVFLPTIDADAPFFQMTDLVLGLNQDIAKSDPVTSFPLIKAKELELEYIAQQLRVLSGEKVKPKIILSELADLSGKNPEKLFINVTARNYLLSYVDSNVAQMKFLAGMKQETVEETKARLARNSNK